MTERHTLATKHGPLAVEELPGRGLPVLLIHGNSSCTTVFGHQMREDVAAGHRLIAFDLPGHGRSGNAPDPAGTYTMPGYADAAVEVLGQLGISEAVVFGWSLGGHVGIEMIPRFPGLQGLMITGTPPVGLADAADGFLPSPHMHLAGTVEFTQEDVDAYARATAGEACYQPFMRDAVARTDGRARKTMFEAFLAGHGIDQRRTVETSSVPLAVVNGGAEPFINLDYIDAIPYANLWEGRCHRLPGLGHAPFFEAPEVFNPVFGRFLRDVEAARGQAASRGQGHG